VSQRGLLRGVVVSGDPARGALRRREAGLAVPLQGPQQAPGIAAKSPPTSSRRCGSAGRAGGRSRRGARAHERAKGIAQPWSSAFLYHQAVCGYAGRFVDPVPKTPWMV